MSHNNKSHRKIKDRFISHLAVLFVATVLTLLSPCAKTYGDETIQPDIEKMQSIAAPSLVESDSAYMEEPDVVSEDKTLKDRQTEPFSEKNLSQNQQEPEDFLLGGEKNRFTSKLPRYGDSFFKTPQSTFAPVQNVPVGPDYVVGPGDEIRVSVWGLEERHFSVTVDRNGSISLPVAGVIGAAGLTFEQLQNAVERAYARFLNEFDINVTMGRLHSITVYVTGNARRPGAYTVSSLSTLVNVLMASGGPSSSGTMRNIQLKRKGKTISTFDAYDLLMKGDKSKDARVMAGDVIFIPTVGNLAAITGDIRTPGVYEMKEKNIPLAKLIDMAGGLTQRAYKGRVQIERFQNHQQRIAFEGNIVNLDADAQGGIPLQNGDLVRIYPVPVANVTINLTGAVAQPGEFAIEKGITKLSDVIQRAGGLLYMASDTAEITRVKVTQQGPKTEHITVNLKQAMKGSPTDDIRLNTDDYIFVRTVPEWDLYKTVKIEGEVRYPGVYTIAKGEPLSSILERAGGFTDKAFRRGAIFTRETEKERQQAHIDETISRLRQELSMATMNAVNSATKSDTADAARSQLDMQKQFLENVQGLKATGRIVIDLPKTVAMLKGTPYDIELTDGDRLIIPTRPNTVHVLGMVQRGTSLVFRPGQPFSTYVKMAGGYATYANWKKTYILRADGSTIQAYRKNRPAIVEEGDAIVVPQKILSGIGARQTKDLVEMISQMAMSFAVIDNIVND
ncbi:MAG: SLBB domain-containing protein [Synergistota bacterium]|nr:SLBB domain-containing protein [Synergistota bacterium]